MSTVDPLPSDDDPPPVKHTFTTAKFEALNEPTATPTPAPTDVHQMLRDNLARENAAGMNVVKPVPKRRSRRKRDFWLMLVLGNLAIAATVHLAGGSVMSNLFGLAGIILLSVSLAWVMWFVMDDY
jgi:predicted phage tail protein